MIKTNSILFPSCTYLLWDVNNVLNYVNNIQINSFLIFFIQIAHCDLAARNILLSDDLEAIVSDFGLATEFKTEGPIKVTVYIFLLYLMIKYVLLCNALLIENRGKFKPRYKFIF